MLLRLSFLFVRGGRGCGSRLLDLVRVVDGRVLDENASNVLRLLFAAAGVILIVGGGKTLDHRVGRGTGQRSWNAKQ